MAGIDNSLTTEDTENTKESYQPRFLRRSRHLPVLSAFFVSVVLFVVKTESYTDMRPTILKQAPWLLLLLLAPALEAQGVVGRWTVQLEEPSLSWRGELRLRAGAGGTPGSGQILLDAADTTWLPLADLQYAEGLLSFTVPGEGGMRFVGVVTGDDIAGEARSTALTFSWRSFRLDADQEYYAAFPRFLQRQIRAGSSRQEVRVPGPWAAAASATPDPDAEYAAALKATGLTPIPRHELASLGVLRAMGVYHRDELRKAAIETLTAVRSGLTSDSARARFDFLFRPHGEWLVDIHDIARDRATTKFHDVSWDAARPALRTAGVVQDDQADVAAVPLALYRLWIRLHQDSAQGGWQGDPRMAEDPVSARAVKILLDGYDEAAEWYPMAMAFLLREPWVGGRQSIAGLVQARWPGAGTPPSLDVRYWGYPEGASRLGVSDATARLVVRPENEDARRWLARRGWSALLVVLHAIPFNFGPATTVESSAGPVRLGSVGRYAAESFNGFLEPADRIDLDPSYVPVLALASVVHEWQHLVAEHVRRNLPGGRSSVREEGDEVVITPPDPFVAEGLAEWRTMTILGSLAKRLPLLTFGEIEKRASLGQDDPHVLGYRMAQALADAVGAVAADSMLILQGDDPGSIASTAPVSTVWAAHASRPDRVFPYRGGVTLIPETRFRVEDGHPEVIESRVRSKK